MQKPVEKRTITRVFICTLLFSLYHIADFSIDLPELTFWNFTNVLKLATSAEGVQFTVEAACELSLISPQGFTGLTQLVSSPYVAGTSKLSFCTHCPRVNSYHKRKRLPPASAIAERANCRLHQRKAGTPFIDVRRVSRLPPSSATGARPALGSLHFNEPDVYSISAEEQ